VLTHSNKAVLVLALISYVFKVFLHLAKDFWDTLHDFWQNPEFEIDKYAYNQDK